MNKTARVSFICVFIIFSIGVYLYGSIQHLKRVNINMELTDQGAYMNSVKRMHQSGYKYLGDRNRMPVYPFLQSLFYNKNADNQEFFEKGKYVNIILSIFLLSCLFLIFKKRLNLFSASNLVLITAFSVFMFKAAYFQCELLFYFLNFISFLAMCRLLIKPSWRYGAAAGFLLGVTYLTKASVLAGIILCFSLLILKAMHLVYKIISNRPNARFYTGRLRSYLFCGMLAALTFILAVYPYIADNKRIFGRYFYNVNTTFYIWCDSWEEAHNGPGVHGSQGGWPDMPPELIPSPQKYFREHNLGQISRRIASGTSRLIGRCLVSYGYFKYCSIYLVFLLFLILGPRKARRTIKSNFQDLLLPAFIFSYFFMYLLLYGWYVPIVADNRLILSQFLPFMFVISALVEKYSKGIFIVFASFKINLLNAYNLLIVCLLISDLPAIMNRVLRMYGGG